MSSSSSCAKPEFRSGQLIAGFEVVKKLGSGGFGAVYHVRKDGLDLALKTEFADGESEQTLKNEVHMLRLMQWSPAFCRLYAAQKLNLGTENVNIMVMTLCSRPLSRLRRMMPDRHFSKVTAARLSEQLLRALHDLHNTGIVHRDVKGSNCGWHAESRRILLFDLGFSRKFLEVDDSGSKMRHREARKTPGFMGTSKYCSVFAHEDLEQGRRDDLWAWLYSTVEFFLGSLPWSHEDKTVRVSSMKKKAGKALYYKCPRELALVYEHVRHLKFDSCPDYQYMLGLFKQMHARLDIDEADPLDFEPGSKYFDEFYANKQSDSENELESETDEAEDEVLDEPVTLSSTTGSPHKAPLERIAAGFNRALNRMMNVGNEIFEA